MLSCILRGILRSGNNVPRAKEVGELEQSDTRQDYSESRYITVGKLDGRLVVMVWTPRGEARRIISMRKANDREKSFYAQHLD